MERMSYFLFKTDPMFTPSTISCVNQETIGMA